MIRLAAAMLALVAAAPALARQEAPQSLEALDAAIAEIVENGSVPGASIAVVEDGEIVLARGYGLAELEAGRPVTPDTLFKAGSTSKNVTSLLALILQERGVLDITDPLSELAPGIAIDNPYETPIRLEHLLEHTAGLEGSTYAEYAFSEPGVSPSAYAEEQAPRLAVRWEPGWYWSYANSGHTLAAAAMERVTGESFDALVEEHVFLPLGMEDATFLRSEADPDRLAASYSGGVPEPQWDMAIRPSGSLIATPSDMARLVQLYLGRGEIDGVRLLDEASIARMEASQTSEAARHGLTAGSYGLGNFGYFEGAHLFQGHWGSTEGFRTHMGYSRAANGGYVVMVNGGAGENHRIRNLVGAYLTRDRPPPEPVTLAAEPIDPASIAGWYAPFSEDMKMRAWLWRLFGAVKVSPAEEGAIRIASVLPHIAAETARPAGGAAFREGDLAVPTIIFFEGADGEPVMVRGQAFGKVGAVTAVGGFWLFALALVCAALAAAHTLIWAPMAVLGRGPGPVGLQVRAGLAIAGASLLGVMILFAQLGLLGGWGALTQLGTVSPLSIALLVLSLAGPVALVWAIGRATGLQARRSNYRFVALALGAPILAGWIMLAVNGWVPLVTFAA
ncbi:MAG: serine hydrolase domain-containing protein [Oceanicaulis sp.]